MKNYILEGKIIKIVEMEEWAAWMSVADKSVGKTEVGDASVSTVFLGIDHSFGGDTPILFETMIFGGEHDQYQERYSTYKKAKQGHLDAVEMCKEK